MSHVWTLGLVIGLAAANGSFADAGQGAIEKRPRLTLVVRDMAGIDAGSREVARAQAIRVMLLAGIDLEWIDANGSANLSLPPNGYSTVVIAATPPAGWTKRDAMGFAPSSTGLYPRAYVFTSLVHAFVQNFIPDKSSFGIVLGHAIVHELGHLLIRGNAHGGGIMRANWTLREWEQAMGGILLFAPNHAKSLRERLLRNGP